LTSVLKGKLDVDKVLASPWLSTTKYWIHCRSIVATNVVRNEFLRRIGRPVKERKHEERNGS